MPKSSSRARQHPRPPKPEARGTPRHSGDWHLSERAGHDYAKHLQMIRSALPPRAWELACLSFHDAQIQTVVQPSKREIVITLDGPGRHILTERDLEGYHHTLSFFGVVRAWVPYTAIGQYWYYQEMHLSEIATFDYQVALWGSSGETGPGPDAIRIQADDVILLSSW